MPTRREFGGCLVAAPLLWFLPHASVNSGPSPVYAYCPADALYNLDSLPADSPATVEAIFEFLSKTFAIRRFYWRIGNSQPEENQPEGPFLCDFVNWLTYLSNQVKVNEIAIAAAHRCGSQIYIVADLFDHGAERTDADPCSGEDSLRNEHPEWCPLDRWGERRGPGVVEFCYPEARRAFISRYMHHVTHYGYDGISFWTYIETVIRYRDEFGFNEPIVREFRRRYGVDIRHQPFDKEAWYRLRGEYLTQFMRELHTDLAAKGKKLSMNIYSPAPNYPEPWDGGHVDFPAAGMIYMDWEGWVQEGIVDELLVWWRGDQKVLLSRMLKVCKGKPVELVVATAKPFEAEWKPFVEAGITPVSVWAPGYEIDRVSLEPSQQDALRSQDWRWRMQALADVTAANSTPSFPTLPARSLNNISWLVALNNDAAAVAALANDPHVLVRRQAMFALGALRASAYIPVLEAGLSDRESSVRIAAAFALAEINGPETPRRIVAALLEDGHFQMKMACVRALAAMKEKAQPVILEGIRCPSRPVREVCVRGLSANNLPGSQSALLSVLEREESELILYYAITGLAKQASREVIEALLRALGDRRLLVQIWAANSLQEMASALSAGEAQVALAALEQLFRQFGDECARADAAWGWRIVGNTMYALGKAGQKALEAMRVQKRDRWLAWAAYEVLYVRRSPSTSIEEKDAEETHLKYAPAFPGWRTTRDTTAKLTTRLQTTRWNG